MALTTSYLVSVKNVNAFFDSLLTAKAPAAFTQKFIEGLGFKSTSDRLYISVLKGLGFIDGNSAPTERYFRFLDQTQSKNIMAEGIEDAYGDLFALNLKANEMPAPEVKNKLKTLTQGKYSDKVIGMMASTFKSLSLYADWSVQQNDKIENKTKHEEVPLQGPVDRDKQNEKTDSFENIIARPEQRKHEFHYNIQVHLPESRDESVYDAIFKSIRRHLL